MAKPIENTITSPKDIEGTDMGTVSQCKKVDAGGIEGSVTYSPKKAESD